MGKRYNISNLNELAEEMRVNGTEDPVAEIQEESYEDLCKTTVDRAEVAAIFAYMIGVSEDVLKKYYEKRYSALLESLNADREATIIRYLCNIRTILMKKFTEVDNRLRYDISNIDRMEYFDKDEIKKLTEWELDLVRPNYRAQDYAYLVTKLIDENIDACIWLFPDSVNFEYIRSAFVPPKYDSKAVMKEEYNKFRSKRLDYPFQRYIYWKPFQYGNILSSDTFYDAQADANDRWIKMGVLCIEMETAGLYMNAAYAGKRALGLFTVSDHILTHEALSAEERQNSFTQMMEIALKTAVKMDKEY